MEESKVWFGVPEPNVRTFGLVVESQQPVSEVLIQTHVEARQLDVVQYYGFNSPWVGVPDSARLVGKQHVISY